MDGRPRADAVRPAGRHPRRRLRISRASRWPPTSARLSVDCRQMAELSTSDCSRSIHGAVCSSTPIRVPPPRRFQPQRRNSRSSRARVNPPRASTVTFQGTGGVVSATTGCTWAPPLAPADVLDRDLGLSLSTVADTLRLTVAGCTSACGR
jgi:hypothetical protein